MMGCTEKSTAAKAANDWQTKLSQEQAFPASITLTASDSAVTAKFGKACQSIVKLQGLQFKDASAAYLCRSFLNRDTPEAAVLALFSKEQIEQADILTREGMMGKDFAAVVLTNAKSEPDAMIVRRTVMQPLLVSLDSSAAAAAWAFLSGVTGEGFHPKNLSTAQVTETAEGWRFDDAEAFTNCKPTETLSFTVSKTGKIKVLSRAEKKNADGTVTAICID